MLYDERRAAMLTESSENKRKVQDLLYDIESFMIDCMYGDDKTILDTKACVSERNNSKCKEFEISNKQRNEIIGIVMEVIEELGVPLKIKGVRIISECVVLALKETLNNRPYYLMKMYPKVAETFGVTVNNAEKLSRYACRYIDLNSQGVAKLGLFRNQNTYEYKDISLKELIDALTEYTIRKCKMKIPTR